MQFEAASPCTTVDWWVVRFGQIIIHSNKNDEDVAAAGTVISQRLGATKQSRVVLWYIVAFTGRGGRHMVRVLQPSARFQQPALPRWPRRKPQTDAPWSFTRFSSHHAPIRSLPSQCGHLLRRDKSQRLTTTVELPFPVQLLGHYCPLTVDTRWGTEASAAGPCAVSGGSPSPGGR